MICRRDFMKGLAAGTAGVAGLGCGGGGAVTGPLAPPGATPRTLRLALPAVGETVAVFDGDVALAVTRISATSEIGRAHV